MINVVLDTNVFISALIKKGTAPNRILREVLNDKFIFLCNPAIVAEYAIVIEKDKFRKYFDVEIAEELMKILILKALMCEPKETKKKFIDEDDKIFYQIALNKVNNNKTYLITGNVKHYPNDEFVITPTEFCNKFIKNIKN